MKTTFSKERSIMARYLSLLTCVLGITAAAIPAYASPTSKKITFTCNAFAPNVITAIATVTLCEGDTGTVPDSCIGQTFQCPTQFICDSSGISAMEDSCSTAFKVGAASVSESYVDDAGTANEVTQSATVTGPWGKGKYGFSSTQVSENLDNDTSILLIK